MEFCLIHVDSFRVDATPHGRAEMVLDITRARYRKGSQSGLIGHPRTVTFKTLDEKLAARLREIFESQPESDSDSGESLNTLPVKATKTVPRVAGTSTLQEHHASPPSHSQLRIPPGLSIVDGEASRALQTQSNSSPSMATQIQQTTRRPTLFRDFPQGPNNSAPINLRQGPKSAQAAALLNILQAQSAKNGTGIVQNKQTVPYSIESGTRERSASTSSRGSADAPSLAREPSGNEAKAKEPDESAGNDEVEADINEIGSIASEQDSSLYELEEALPSHQPRSPQGDSAKDCPKEASENSKVALPPYQPLREQTPQAQTQAQTISGAMREASAPPPRLPDAKYIKYARRRIPKDQRQLLDKDESWLPSLPGKQFPPGNIPNATIQLLQVHCGDLAPEEERSITHRSSPVQLPENADAEDVEMGDSESQPIPWSSSPVRPMRTDNDLPPDSSAVRPLTSIALTCTSNGPEPSQRSGPAEDSDNSDLDLVIAVPRPMKRKLSPVNRQPTHLPESSGPQVDVLRSTDTGKSSGKSESRQIDNSWSAIRDSNPGLADSQASKPERSQPILSSIPSLGDRQPSSSPLKMRSNYETPLPLQTPRSVSFIHSADHISPVQSTTKPVDRASRQTGSDPALRFVSQQSYIGPAFAQTDVSKRGHSTDDQAESSIKPPKKKRIVRHTGSIDWGSDEVPTEDPGAAYQRLKSKSLQGRRSETKSSTVLEKQPAGSERLPSPELPWRGRGDFHESKVGTDKAAKVSDQGPSADDRLSESSRLSRDRHQGRRRRRSVERPRGDYYGSRPYAINDRNDRDRNEGYRDDPYPDARRRIPDYRDDRHRQGNDHHNKRGIETGYRAAGSSNRSSDDSYNSSARSSRPFRRPTRDGREYRARAQLTRHEANRTADHRSAGPRQPPSAPRLARLHAPRSSAPPPPVFDCSICKRRFSSEKNMNGHLCLDPAAAATLRKQPVSREEEAEAVGLPVDHVRRF